MRACGFIDDDSSQQFLIRPLATDQEILGYVSSTVLVEMRSYGVPISPENHFTRLCSAFFEGIHKVVEAGQSFLANFKRLDQRNSLKIAVGQQVSIINIVMSGGFVELFGFKTPKLITKIRRDSSDKIVQIEFDNNEADVWPRNSLASFNGNLLMTSAFFKSGDDVEQALTMLHLSKPEELQMRVSLQERKNESN